MKELTLNEVISKYIEKGFGSMNKNDFEVWIFHYLLEHELQGKKNYEISIGLKIPKSKVKRLRYEAELKYSKIHPLTNIIWSANISNRLISRKTASAYNLS